MRNPRLLSESVVRPETLLSVFTSGPEEEKGGEDREEEGEED